MGGAVRLRAALTSIHQGSVFEVRVLRPNGLPHRVHSLRSASRVFHESALAVPCGVATASTAEPVKPGDTLYLLIVSDGLPPAVALLG